MKPEWVSFAEVKAAASMRLVLEDYGRCRKCGNVFHCFACGAGGNVLELVDQLEGKLVTEKREGNPILPFSRPSLVADHPYVSDRGLSRETASRFQIARYKFPAGFRKSAVLFNYHRAAARNDRRVVVVEGFFDCMRVYQAGFGSIVADGSRTIPPAGRPSGRPVYRNHPNAGWRFG